VGKRTARRVRKWALDDSPKNARAKAHLVGQLANGFGPRMEERVSSKFLELVTTRTDVHMAMAKLGQGLFRTTAEVARTIRERGLPDVPGTLVISGYLPANTPKGTRKMLQRIRAEHESIAQARGYTVEKLPDVSHQIPLEAPDECVQAACELLARIGKSKEVSSRAT